MNKKIVVLGTGGTIAGTADRPGEPLAYTAGQIGIAQLLDGLPALAQGGLGLVSEQLAQVDSKDMEAALWQLLARRVAHWLAQPQVQGIVITHGTDTLEETAWFLQSVLAPAKPVVLTCAMRPATALAPDGPQNLQDAIAVAAQPGASGVVAVCAGVIHSAQDVQKVHPYRLDAFSSGDAGALGYIEQGRLRLVRNWPEALADQAQTAIKKIVDGNTALAWPWVEIVLSHAGASGRAVQALQAAGVAGLVVAGTGNGTLHHALEAALLQAQQAGVPVLRATRCLEGRVLPHAGDRLPDAGGLSPVKARVTLMLALMDRP